MSEHFNEAKFDLFYKLYEKVNSVKDRAIYFYNQEAIRLGLNPQNRTWKEGDITDVDYSGIDISWEQYARSCRVDNDIYSIPTEALSDDTYKEFITDFVNRQLIAQNKEISEKTQRELNWKKAELERLKKELGEA